MQGALFRGLLHGSDPVDMSPFLVLKVRGGGGGGKGDGREGRGRELLGGGGGERMENVNLGPFPVL